MSHPYSLHDRDDRNFASLNSGNSFINEEKDKPNKPTSLLVSSFSGVLIAVYLVFAGWFVRGVIDPAQDTIIVPAADEANYILPGNPYFSVAKLAWNQYNQLNETDPVGIALCDSSDAVKDALAWANAANTSVTVRSGRHNYARLSVGTGLVIDVAQLDTIEIDQISNTATIGTGARMYDVFQAFAALNMLFPGGTCPDVALGGLFLGGGQGMSTRQLGLASDTVVSVRIVINDPSMQPVLVEATETNEYSDLLWALRGGGSGEFGVIINITMDTSTYHLANYTANNLHDDADNNDDDDNELMVSYFEYEWVVDDGSNAEDIAAALYDQWAMLVENMPLGMTTRFNLLNAKTIYMDGMYLTGDGEQVMKFITPIINSTIMEPSTAIINVTTLGNTMLWVNGCHSREECNAIVKAVPLPGSDSICLKQGSLYSGKESPSTDMVRQGIRSLHNTTNGFIYLLGVYGGNFAEMKEDRGPYTKARNASIWMEIEAFWECNNVTDENSQVKWHRSTYAALAPYLSTTPYRNHPDLDLGTHWLEMYFTTDNAKRLKEIKAKYDPTCRFRNAQSIVP